ECERRAGGDAARGGIAMIVPILKIALRALARNKARSALTMLGIIIGVASVIAMVSLGQGAQKQVKDQISNMGANLLIVQARGQSQMGQDQDDTVLVPYTTVMKKLLATNYISSIQVSAVSEEATAPAQQQIAALLRARHNIRSGQEDDFTVRNLSDVAETAAETSRVMTMLLGGIAAVSLLVGGIGIMNIMLVSVTERTREIGIRMAVGARSKHVQYQFLIEALILGLAGGLTGIAVGAATSYGVS